MEYTQNFEIQRENGSIEYHSAKFDEYGVYTIMIGNSTVPVSFTQRAPNLVRRRDRYTGTQLLHSPLFHDIPNPNDLRASRIRWCLLSLSVLGRESAQLSQGEKER